MTDTDAPLAPQEQTNKAAHTPGPWRINPEYKEIVLAGTDTQIAVAGARPGFNPLVVMGEQLANAALIAAAPDLLAACQRARDAINFHKDMSAADRKQAFDQLESAIARAEGRQP